MAFKQIICALTAVLAVGCGSDHYLIGYAGETVYVETVVEVPVYVENEVPADPGEIWVDSFTQPQSVDGVDILWVIDTSGSMYRYEEELMAGIEAMLNALPPSGWRLAMTSNDPAKASVEAQFPLVPGDDIDDATLMYGDMGIGHREAGFDASYEYIENNPYAQTWMRDDAALLVVMVSDEEEQSTTLTAVNDFTGWYDTKRGGSVFLSSIINLDPAESECNTNLMNVGDRYSEATNYFNGVIVDICSDDWAPGVAEASVQIEPFESISLTHEAVEDSIRVFIDGQVDPNWHYVATDNTVYFDIIPPAHSLVEVGYLYHEVVDTGDTGDTAA